MSIQVQGGVQGRPAPGVRKGDRRGDSDGSPAGLALIPAAPLASAAVLPHDGAMSDTDKPAPGQLAWHDLTVDDASGIRDFYADVVGWEFEGLSMGDYDDYVMKAPGGDAVAGVCHARGSNAGVPPQWLLYVVVADLAASLAVAQAKGGEVVHGPRTMPGGSMAVVRDPAGAVLGLWQHEG